MTSLEVQLAHRNSRQYFCKLKFVQGLSQKQNAGRMAELMSPYSEQIQHIQSGKKQCPRCLQVYELRRKCCHLCDGVALILFQEEEKTLAAALLLSLKEHREALHEPCDTIDVKTALVFSRPGADSCPPVALSMILEKAQCRVGNH